MKYQKLYAIVSKSDGRIMKKHNGNKLGIFVQKGTALQHAWRYGATGDNFEIVEYIAERKAVS